MRQAAQAAGWLSLVALAVLTLKQGQGLSMLQGGNWSISLMVLVLVAALIAPVALTRALPAAALAVLLGGILFSQLPEQTGLNPVAKLLQGTVGAAAVAALGVFAGRRDFVSLAEAVLAGVLHAGLLQALTFAPMLSPFALWPWLAPVLLLAWIAVVAVLLGARALMAQPDI